jgi:hypothetical protein
MGFAQEVALAEKLFEEAATSFIPAMMFGAQLVEVKLIDNALSIVARRDPEGKFKRPQKDGEDRLALMYGERNGDEKRTKL